MVIKKNMAAKFFLVILLSLLVPDGVGNVTAQENALKVKAIGTGMIRGKDVASAREEAISNAMVSSVYRAMADLVPEETLVSNFKRLDESIFENIGDYILEYKVLAENTSGKTYRIMIEATPFEEKIKELLYTPEKVTEEKNYPKILLLLAEQNIDDILPSYWWGEDPSFVKGLSEKALMNVLVEHGFSVIDHERMLLYQNEKSHINNPYLENRQAVQLGRHLEADVVLVGTAVAEIVPVAMGVTTRSVRADLSVRAIRVDTGEEITTVDQQSVEVGSDDEFVGPDPLMKVGMLAGKALAPKLVQDWKSSESSSGQIELFVKGTGNLSSFVSFRKSLVQIPGISNLQIKETMADEALILVDYSGSAQNLAEIVMQKAFDDFRVNILEVGSTHINMDLIPGRGFPKP